MLVAIDTFFRALVASFRQPSKKSDRAALQGHLTDWTKRVYALKTRTESSTKWWWPFNDPSLSKHLDRTLHALADLQRLAPSFDERTATQVETLYREFVDLSAPVKDQSSRMTSDDAETLFHKIQLVLVEVGDAEVLCALTERELEWTKRTTSWLTWDVLFGTELPKAVDEYRKGKTPNKEELSELRHKNLSLQRVRHDDEIAHRARAEARSQNLKILAVVLVVLLACFLLFYWYAVDASLSTIFVVPFAGALGAALSGTIKARDRLTRQGDIRRFRDGLAAQLLAGASAGVVVVLFLEGGLIEIGGLTGDTIQQQAAFAFIGGFSEPFFLKTVARVGELGQTQESDASKTA